MFGIFSSDQGETQYIVKRRLRAKVLLVCFATLKQMLKRDVDVKREKLYSCPVPWRGLRRRIRRDRSSTTRRSE